jgi:phenylpyruvate tautomerase PptA (4-oxalocrotonate tautomerase family)
MSDTSELERLRAELAEAKRVMAARPSPKGIEELTEAIVEILGDPDETTVEAFLSFASAEVARIVGSEMVARWQAEDLLRIAHETSNRSEAERARAVAERDALKAAVEALAERWENALAVDRPYARALRASLNTLTPTTRTETP